MSVMIQNDPQLLRITVDENISDAVFWLFVYPSRDFGRGRVIKSDDEDVLARRDIEFAASGGESGNFVSFEEIHLPRAIRPVALAGRSRVAAGQKTVAC